MDKCIVKFNGIHYIVVRTLIPPTNNTLLVLVPPTPDNAFEIATIAVPIKLEKDECAFIPDYDEIAKQLLENGVIKETDEAFEGAPVQELAADEDNLHIIPIYKIDLNEVETVPALTKHLPEELLNQYMECCNAKKNLDEVSSFSQDEFNTDHLPTMTWNDLAKRIAKFQDGW